MTAEASDQPSVVDQFFEGLMELGAADFQLVRNQYQRQWETSEEEVLDARRAVLDALGAVFYHDVFDAASSRTPDEPQTPAWWAAGDAATALAARKKIDDAHYQLLVRPLAVALNWLPGAKSRVNPL